MNLIQLSPDYRVRPLDHLQWVLERRQKGRPSQLKLRGETWLPYAYCRTKAGLETALSACDARASTSIPSSSPTCQRSIRKRHIGWRMPTTA